jgi:hypothetical protein
MATCLWIYCLSFTTHFKGQEGAESARKGLEVQVNDLQKKLKAADEATADLQAKIKSLREGLRRDWSSMLI